MIPVDSQTKLPVRHTQVRARAFCSGRSTVTARDDLSRIGIDPLHVWRALLDPEQRTAAFLVLAGPSRYRCVLRRVGPWIVEDRGPGAIWVLSAVPVSHLPRLPRAVHEWTRWLCDDTVAETVETTDPTADAVQADPETWR